MADTSNDAGPALVSDKELARYRDTGYLVKEAVLTANEAKELQAETSRLVAAGKPGDAANDAAAKSAYTVGGGNTVSSFAYDFEPDGRVRRVTRPDLASDAFDRLKQHPTILAMARRLLGCPSLRMGNFKLNVKVKGGGSAIQWHQDWSYYPHTNDDLCAIGIFIDDMTPDNGPLQVVPRTHTGPIYNHHNAEGFFQGGFDITKSDLAGRPTATLLGKAGTVSFHHVRAVHGSDWNRSHADRRVIFLEVAAGDAWPLSPAALTYEKAASNLLCGTWSGQPRMVACPIRLPLPRGKVGTLYEIQETMDTQSFSKDGDATDTAENEAAKKPRLD